MKKKTGKIAAFILALAMVGASACTAFAGTSDDVVKAKEIETVELQQAADGQEQARTISSIGDMSRNGVTEGIGFVTLNTGYELDSESYFNDNIGYTEYGINSPSVAGNAYYKGYSQQEYIPAKGTVIMTVAAEDDSQGSNGYVRFGVFKDAALTQPVDSTMGVNSGADGKVWVFNVPSAGTYYLGVYSSISSSSAAKNYGVAALAAYSKGTDRTLSNGKWTAVGQKDAQTNYFKFKATSTGYIKVSNSDRVYVTLCSSKKKALSGEDWNLYDPVYGVKKGNTYYVKVRALYNTSGMYQLKVTNTGVSEKSGTTKSKAVTIKKGSTKKGTITAGSSQADWYKFKLTSKKTVKMTIKGATNDQLKIAVYDGKKVVKTSTIYNNTKSITLTSVGKWSKGTYHIKVYRGNSKSSGWYSLKWQ